MIEDRVKIDVKKKQTSTAKIGDVSIKIKPGTAFMDCIFGNVRKSFAVRDVSHNVFYVDNHTARINDSDGNRYIVNINKLNKKRGDSC